MIDKISVVGNFICTKDKRLEVLEKQIKNLAFIFDGCDFLINYNAEKNLNEVKSLFKSSIKSNNLFFSNDLTSDWTKTTLDLFNRCKTIYAFLMVEDYVYDYSFNSSTGSKFANHILNFDDDRLVEVNLNGRKIFWENMIQECFDNNIKHVFMTKIKKYLPPSPFVTGNHGYVDGENIYIYSAKNSPTGVFSMSAIHDRDIFIEVLEEHIKKHVSRTPGEFESRSEIIRSFGDMRCAIPKDDITIQAHLDGVIDR